MLFGHLDDPETYRALLTAPVWQEVLKWLRQNAAKKKPGEYPIRGREVYALVQTLTTVPRRATVFEAHQRYVDVHSVLAGEEIIEWAPITVLAPCTAYDTTNDYTLYKLPAQTTALTMTPGFFAVFFPADAHLPKLAAVAPAPITKVVIKISAALVR